jgi:hypothetical protein
VGCLASFAAKSTATTQTSKTGLCSAKDRLHFSLVALLNDVFSLKDLDEGSVVLPDQDIVLPLKG